MDISIKINPKFAKAISKVFREKEPNPLASFIFFSKNRIYYSDSYFVVYYDLADYEKIEICEEIGNFGIKTEIFKKNLNADSYINVDYEKLNFNMPDFEKLINTFENEEKTLSEQHYQLLTILNFLECIKSFYGVSKINKSIGDTLLIKCYKQLNIPSFLNYKDFTLAVMPVMCRKRKGV